MLQSLHVKNLALMEETEVEFQKGLNILTGETGAGKSLLLGSISLALGAKFEKEMLRRGADSALVELVFRADEPRIARKIEELDLAAQEDGTVLISRRMQPGKNVYRLNGETVTARQVKELAELLLDIHGQQEHQSLLHQKKHMEILDAYCGESVNVLLGEVEALYRECRDLRRAIEEESMEEAAREKRRALAEYEWREIEDARLRSGEDAELERRYRRMSNSRKITEALAESGRYALSHSETGAGSSLSRALRILRGVTAYDGRLAELEEQLVQIDGLLADFGRELSGYLEDLEFDQEDFQKTEERLNEVNRLKGKYGSTIEEIQRYGRTKQQELETLFHYDAAMEERRTRLLERTRKLEQTCARLTQIRAGQAKLLTRKLTAALVNLNFLTVEFRIQVKPASAVTLSGQDEVEFLISTNPGEECKPLSQVASGGELSRIMLAVQTVLAQKAAVDTLIFDEIDAGIGGKTAWKVSEQLDHVSRAHQVICITHLPQIAAMADVHFLIEKSSTNEATITDIRLLEGEDSLKELARMLGSDTVTEASLRNAREMKGLALRHKEKFLP
jgi:DNA repair protein RecN (Recombination protein N)